MHWQIVKFKDGMYGLAGYRWGIRYYKDLDRSLDYRRTPHENYSKGNLEQVARYLLQLTDKGTEVSLTDTEIERIAYPKLTHDGDSNAI